VASALSSPMETLSSLTPLGPPTAATGPSQAAPTRPPVPPSFLVAIP
jgi:hypothetical protein